MFTVCVAQWRPLRAQRGVNDLVLFSQHWLTDAVNLKSFTSSGKQINLLSLFLCLVFLQFTWKMENSVIISSAGTQEVGHCADRSVYIMMS